MEFGQLVLRQRFGGKEIEGAGLGVAKHRLQDGQVVAGRLAGSGGCHDHEVCAGQRQSGRLRLVGVEPADPASCERLAQAGV